MFKPASPQSDLNGLLDRGSHIHGELRFDEEFVIRGRLTGSIQSAGVLKVGDEGELEGEFHLRQVVVSGTIKGTLHATESIHITSTGRVLADLLTPSLTIEDGAFFEGRCSMSPASDQRNDASEAQKVTKMPIAHQR
jgi:cytoskeletal protein CcmA (bactofilin family)